MKLWSKGALGILATLSVCFVGVIIILWRAADGLCANDMFSETISPDGSRKAIVFERNCGATTSFYTQVSILDADSELGNNAGNILVIDGRPESAAVEVRWIDDRRVELSSPGRYGRLVDDKVWVGGEISVSYVSSTN